MILPPCFMNKTYSADTEALFCGIHAEKGKSMPTISSFYGILIQMFWNDHAPPHFDALYAEHEALIDIKR